MEFNSFDIDIQIDEFIPEEYEDWLNSLPDLLAEALEKDEIID